MHPSFFVAHVYYWGDTHIENFGLTRASAISCAGSALKAGITFTFHQDAPVLPPNMLDTIGCAVCRTTQNGVVLGAQESIPVYEALRACTVNAAYQYKEENKKGILAPGMRADMVILSDNPLTAHPHEIKNIQVLQTIKDGKSVYRL